MQSAHKNINKKPPSGFFGLSCCICSVFPSRKNEF